MLETNKIYNIDCCEGLEQLDDNCIDLTVTSPPYDNMRSYNGFSFNFEKTAKLLYQKTKPGGVVVWVVSDQTSKDNESGTSFKQALYFKEIGFKLHDTMIYLKTNVGACGSHNGYNQAFEYMFVFSKGKMRTFNPIKDLVPKKANMTASYAIHRSTKEGYVTQKVKKTAPPSSKRTNVWSYTIGFCSGDDSTGHPAMFPEKLAQDHILSWSNENDLILDPFMGAGTTAKMAIINHRNYIGFEIDKIYCETAEKRISTLTGIKND